MDSIKTLYNGIWFRSKLESQWAKFFDTFGIKYVYEVEGYRFSDGTKYLPDFYLVDQDAFFEVKGIMTEFDLHKVELLCAETQKDVYIGYPGGNIDVITCADNKIQKSIGGGVSICKCGKCNTTLMLYDFGISRNDILECPKCKSNSSEYRISNFDECYLWVGKENPEWYEFSRIEV